MNQVISISLPSQMTKKVDAAAKWSDQTRSELVRSALRDYLSDQMEERVRFTEAYNATRKEPIMTFSQLKKKYKLS